MTVIHHLLCGSMHAPPNAPAICHCLLLQEEQRLALVDTGLGLLDMRYPDERLTRALIDMVGFNFDETTAAVRQIEGLGLPPEAAEHVILTHADPDHTGGLADFPRAVVHLSAEEHRNLTDSSPRYRSPHFQHGPRWQTHGASDRRWFGLEARPVDLGFRSEVLLIPLFGHTAGHCGVAIEQQDRWVLHAGDAYYLRAELASDDHPVSRLAEMRADDDVQRRASLRELRRLVEQHADEIEIFGYHDPDEFPDARAIHSGEAHFRLEP